MAVRKKKIIAVQATTDNEVKEGQLLIKEDTKGNILEISQRKNGQMVSLSGSQNLKETLLKGLEKLGMEDSVIKSLDSLLITPLDNFRSKVEILAGYQDDLCVIFDTIVCNEAIINEREFSWSPTNLYSYNKNAKNILADKIIINFHNTTETYSTAIAINLRAVSKTLNIVLNILDNVHTSFGQLINVYSAPLDLLDLEVNAGLGSKFLFKDLLGSIAIKTLRIKVNGSPKVISCSGLFPENSDPDSYNEIIFTDIPQSSVDDVYVNTIRMQGTCVSNITVDSKGWVIRELVEAGGYFRSYDNPIYLQFDYDVSTPSEHPWLSRTDTFYTRMLSRRVVEMHLKGIGSNHSGHPYWLDFYNCKWTIGLLESLRDDSYDRAAHGLDVFSIFLSEESYDSLTAEERALIEAKGYRLYREPYTEGIIIGSF